jgi:hypothetical protein
MFPERPESGLYRVAIQPFGDDLTAANCAPAKLLRVSSQSDD